MVCTSHVSVDGTQRVGVTDALDCALVAGRGKAVSCQS